MRAGVLVGLALACAGCVDAASPDPGLSALMQVDGAQFRPGPFPSPSGGPAALSLGTKHGSVTVGRLGESARGIVETNARGAVFGIAGSDGTWIVPASAGDIDSGGYATAKMTFGLAASFPPGPFDLLVAVSDDQGRFGEPARTTVVATADPPPTGELVISLTWDSAADLDLHVIDALGGEAFSEHPNTWQRPPPGEPVDPTAYLTGGILDHDGNRDCHRDGSPNENVVWTMPPPAGTYHIRVDVPMLCGDAGASWYVAAYRNDLLLGAARGISTADDELQPHGAGAGVLALTFDVQ